jgi:hypothetical protein
MAVVGEVVPFRISSRCTGTSQDGGREGMAESGVLSSFCFLLEAVSVPSAMKCRGWTCNV